MEASLKQSRKQWLKDRQRGIGGSDVGPILGLMKEGSPLKIYFDKIEEEPTELPRDNRIDFGLMFEDVIADIYQSKTGRKVRRVNDMRFHPDHPWKLANIDRAIIDNQDGRGPGILEIKTVGGMAMRHWEDEIPYSYYAQVQHYLDVFGYQWADVAILVFNDARDFRIEPIERDDAFIDAMHERLNYFWHNHVLAGNPPEPTDASDILLLHPESIDGHAVEASPNIAEAHKRLVEVKAAIKALEGQKADFENVIKKHMGDAETLRHEGLRLATWKSSKTRRLDSKAIQAAHAELCAQFMTETSSRRFLVK